GTETGDSDEGITGPDLPSVYHQAGDFPGGIDAGHVRQQARQRDGGRVAACHGCAPLSAAPSGSTGAASSGPRFLACAAIQVSMSSGGTSISRSAPSITDLNTGAAVAPPP